MINWTLTQIKNCVRTRIWQDAKQDIMPDEDVEILFDPSVERREIMNDCADKGKCTKTNPVCGLDHICYKGENKLNDDIKKEIEEKAGDYASNYDYHYRDIKNSYTAGATEFYERGRQSTLDNEFQAAKEEWEIKHANEIYNRTVMDCVNAIKDFADLPEQISISDIQINVSVTVRYLLEKLQQLKKGE